MQVIIDLSIGTLVIIGLHIVAITVINFTLEHIHHINYTICYHWYEALLVAIAIVFALYPIIILAKRHIPTLLGRKNN